MKEFVLKRIANVTSAEALDQISESYPDVEILSFRKVKEAGNENEFFIARIRVAAMADESDDVVLDSEDIVIEDKQHEDKEEEKMNEIIRLLKELVDNSSDSELEQDEEPSVPELGDDHERKPLPKPQSPPMGVAGIGSGITPVATVVERPADVPIAAARVELLRDFSPEFKIESINKTDDKYRAVLIKRSVTEQDEAVQDAWTLQEEGWLEKRRQMEENQRAYQRAKEEEKDAQKQRDRIKKAPPRDLLETEEYKNLGWRAQRWVDVMDEAGATDDDIMAEIEYLNSLDESAQDKEVEKSFKRWRAHGQDFEPESATGSMGQHQLNPEAWKVISSLIRQAKAQLMTVIRQEQNGIEIKGEKSLALKRLKDLEALNGMLSQIPTDEQLGFVKSIYGEQKSKPVDYRAMRRQLRDVAGPLVREKSPVQEQQPVEEKKPRRRSEPQYLGPYHKHLYNAIGPGSSPYYDKLRWNRELADYKKNQQEAEKGWASGA